MSASDQSPLTIPDDTDSQQVPETLDLFSDEQQQISSPEMILGEPYIHRWDIYG